MTRALPLICMVWLLCPLTLFAEQWPQFRGPSGQGHSQAKDLPLEWSRRKNVTWNVDVPGKGWSSPIVFAGKVYLTTAIQPESGEGHERSLRALCLNAADGKTVWDIEVFRQEDQPSARIHSKNSHASPTPITDGKHLFVHFGTHGTACLTLGGDVVWRTRELVYNPRHGSGGSPVLVDDLLVVSCDGYDVQFVIALDRATGKIRWKKERPPTENLKRFAFATPLVIEAAGQQQIVSPGANSVVAYNPADGREIWMVRHTGYSVVPRPVFGHGLVYVGTSFNEATLLAIRPDGRNDVSDTHVAWRSSRSIPHTPSMLLIGDDLYFVSDSGIASCVDAVSGELHWKQRLRGKYSASPLFADGRIYIQSEEGVTKVIQPGHKYQQLARNDLGERTFASPAVVDSALLIRTENQLFRIEKPQSFRIEKP